MINIHLVDTKFCRFQSNTVLIFNKCKIKMFYAVYRQMPELTNIQ